MHDRAVEFRRFYYRNIYNIWLIVRKVCSDRERFDIGHVRTSSYRHFRRFYSNLLHVYRVIILNGPNLGTRLLSILQ